jgi:hypothetical protein
LTFIEEAPVEELPPPTPPVVVPPVRGASLADLNEQGAWLIPRMVEHWGTTPAQAMFYLRGTLSSNEQRVLCCGDAVGMSHIEPGRMGHPCRVVVDFVLSKRGIDGVDECCEIYDWMLRWSKSLGASGLFRVDDFSDAERSFIRAKIGKLVRRESFNAVF